MPDGVPTQSNPYRSFEKQEDIIHALQKPLLDRPDVPLVRFPEGAESAHPFVGGSAPAFKRLKHILSSGAASKYKDTRNEMLGTDFSTKLSAYLAHGCISSGQIHKKLEEWEEKYNRGQENKGTAAIRFELLWRDYMRLCLEKYKSSFFHLHGFNSNKDKNRTPKEEWKSPYSDSGAQKTFQRWLSGKTSTGLIDASQRELLLTGYISNRARQNTASFLAARLRIDWRLGAEWFESMLVDYDCASNWGNWAYVAGVGNDPRAGRMFNPVKQSHDYDPEGSYIRAWVEEVRDVESVSCVWQMWKLPKDQRDRLKIMEPLVRINWDDRK